MVQPTDKGILYLIPTTLSETQALEVLPMSVKKIIENLRHYIVENEKTARKSIKKVAPNLNQEELHIYTLNKFTKPEEYQMYLNPCMQGASTGIMSEAGCPGVADPGAEIVSLAHQMGIRVLPLVGPSSVLLALMGSGLNGQSFAFIGYLPIDKNERRKRIRDIESHSRRENQTQLFIETPYRNLKLYQELLRHCGAHTRLSIACNLTSPDEYIFTQSIAEWRNGPEPDIDKKPCMFLLLAE